MVLPYLTANHAVHVSLVHVRHQPPIVSHTPAAHQSNLVICMHQSPTELTSVIVSLMLTLCWPFLLSAVFLSCPIICKYFSMLLASCIRFDVLAFSFLFPWVAFMLPTVETPLPCQNAVHFTLLLVSLITATRLCERVQPLKFHSKNTLKFQGWTSALWLP